jgi:hypothetical protein
MCTKIPVSELIQLPITWVRGDDERLQTVFKSLKAGNSIEQPIRLIKPTRKIAINIARNFKMVGGDKPL